MGKRKTVDVAALVRTVNERNRKSFCAPAVRRGWNDLVETILHDTGNYSGFRYLTAKEIELCGMPGQAPGINVDEHGPLADYDARFAGCDDTRVEYYLK